MVTNASSGLEGLRILIVEDMLLVADEINYQLRVIGCEVIGPCSNVADARLAIERQNPEAALVDVNLRGESGFPIADELCKRNVPFLFMTGYDSAYLPTEYRRFDCIQKPFTADQLREVMWKTFLQHSQSGAARPVHPGAQAIIDAATE